MAINNDYRLTHDVYGKAAFADVTEDFIINYFILVGELVTSVYNRRTTATTESRGPLPRSLS
jgi:hypothetical protein